MLSISKDANINYLAKVVKINSLCKHPNADKLQIAIVDFQEVIVDLDVKIGDIMIFFPLESQINQEFLSYTNSFRHSNLNRVVDDEHTGFFEDNRRVRAVKLRGQKSMGVLFPAEQFQNWIGGESLEVGTEFDSVGKTIIVQKYMLPVKQTPNQRLGKKPKVSRLVDGQVHLHTDTENLLRNITKLSPDDYISITYKVHGTSFWVSNVLVKRNLNLFEKLLKSLGIKIKETEYDYVYGSRKVVKNANMDDPKRKDHFYEYDLWGDIKEEIKEFIPKGYTIYGECLGFTKGDAYIQSQYDYGCEPCKNKLMIYRITFTNEDGIVYNLSTNEIKDYCDRVGLEYVPLFYYGVAKDLCPQIDESNHWHENYVKYLQDKFTEKDCYICKNKVPEEGIVLRKEGQFEFETYKLKSFRFLEFETKLLDEGVEDIESVN